MITGALRRLELERSLAVLDTLDRWLAPVTTRGTLSAWSREWVFAAAPVDADTILPALATLAPELDVGDDLAFSFGVLTPAGAYVSLARESSSIADAAEEAVILAAQERARYGNALADELLEDDLPEETFFELEAAT